MITLTVNGKDYFVAAPQAHHTMHNGFLVTYDYFSTRNGERFGPIRRASSINKPKSVGGQLVAAAVEAYDVDTEAMIVEASRVTAEKLAQYEEEGRTSYGYPTVELITRHSAIVEAIHG